MENLHVDYEIRIVTYDVTIWYIIEKERILQLANY